MLNLVQLLLVALASLFVQPHSSSEKDHAKDLDSLLDGIEQLNRPKNALPGNVIPYGPEAFTVASSSSGDEASAVIAAARFGRGRLVAFGHGAFLGDWDLQGAGGQFLVNSIGWVCPVPARKTPRVAVIGGNQALITYLEGQFARMTSMKQFPEQPALGEGNQYDVLLWCDGRLNEEQRLLLQNFTKAGAGVLLGVCPWGNQQIFDGQGAGKSIRTDLSQNQFMAPMGIVFGDGYVHEQQYETDPTKTDKVHAGRAAQSALDQIRGKESKRSSLSAQAAASQTAALLRALPPGELVYGPRFEKALGSKSFAQHVPTAKRSTPREDVIGYLGMLLATQRWKDASAEEIDPAPGFEHFPGSLPKGAKRLTVQIEVTGEQIRRGGWISTGHYAPAGESIEIAFEGGQAPSGWSIRIGAHKDELWQKQEWRRWPEVTMQREIKLDSHGRFLIASPFGGLIYLVPGKSARASNLELRGVVEAPYFELESAPSVKDWKRRRKAPAPWAELACEGIVITVPSGSIRNLEDPVALMQYWKRAMQQYPLLRGEPQPMRAERLVEDLQISAGWMHSGYPVMTHGADDLESSFAVDLDTLREEGNWGYFHEFGHNAQKSDWTFSGTTEVTCNLFSLFLGEQMAGIEPWNNPWLVNQHNKPAPYFAEGSPFEQWKREPGLALMMYATIQKEFGWAPFQKAFRSYLELPESQRPKSELEKHDSWLKILSESAERDFGPYFERWGVPTTEAARLSLKHLETWIPGDYPAK